jgi:hypothetical protein
MAEVIRFALVKDQWTPFFANVNQKTINRTLSEIGFKTSLAVQRNLVREANRRGWKNISGSIKVQRKGKQSFVMMSQKGVWRDSAEPHYVALKRGRKIVKWTKDRLPLQRKTGKSRIYQGSRGGIIGGAIYVTPTPWINRPTSQGLRNMNRIANLEINKILR